MAPPTLLPLDYRPDSETYFSRLSTMPGVVWLDSGTDREGDARYDILTALPREEITATTDGCQIRHRDGTTETFAGALLNCLEQRLHNMGFGDVELPHTSPFCGGAIGYLSYEGLHSAYGLRAQHEEADGSHFGLYDWALVQDHQQKRCFLYVLPGCPRKISDQVRERLATTPGSTESFQCSRLEPDVDKETYLTAVARIKRYIEAGDTYQVNFSQRFTGEFSGSAAACYRHLRQALSGPFSAFLDTPDGAVLSLSPERFLEAQGDQVRTQPIKGTAPRGATPEADVALARELQASEKNRAENVMIVDLLRNDLSKVCVPFSVKVPELFGLQSFSNVHHLVSTVTGQLACQSSLFDLIRATFPGGSITGAPKKRAMEIIAELEPHRRSVYCGSIFYISLHGRMDSNIAIRTLLQRHNRIHCWGGGGIVADSDPAEEYQESLHKVGVLLESLGPSRTGPATF